MLLTASGAPFEVSLQQRHGSRRVDTCELELDETVELREALVATDLRPIRPEELRKPPRQRLPTSTHTHPTYNRRPAAAP